MHVRRQWAFFLILFGLIILPQTNPISSGSSPNATAAKQATTVVKLAVLVTDKNKQVVTGLKQEDFLVYEDAQPRPVTLFQPDAPIQYGVVVDNTGSMRSLVPQVLRATETLLSRHRSDDQAFIARIFDSDVHLTTGWTADKEKLLDSLKTLNEGKGALSTADALIACADYFSQSPPTVTAGQFHRALVLITDGDDKKGNTQFPELVKRLRQDKLQVFPIGIFDPDIDGLVMFGRNPRMLAMEFLNKFVDATGTRAVYSETNSVPQMMGQLAASYLQSQYIIGYAQTSVGKNKPGKVQVKLVERPNQGKLTLSSWPLS